MCNQPEVFQHWIVVLLFPNCLHCLPCLNGCCIVAVFLSVPVLSCLFLLQRPRLCYLRSQQAWNRLDSLQMWPHCRKNNGLKVRYLLDRLDQNILFQNCAICWLEKELSQRAFNPQKISWWEHGSTWVFSSFSYNFMHNFSYMKICRFRFLK